VPVAVAVEAPQQRLEHVGPFSLQAQAAVLAWAASAVIQRPSKDQDLVTNAGVIPVFPPPQG
jgi:hypothetical protein